MTTARTRSYTWIDPSETANVAPQLSGLEFLRRLAAGELPPPPISETLDFKITEVEEGRVVFVAHPAEFHYNPIGSVHGGYAATLLDSALGCSVHSTLPAGSGYTTAELKVNLVRPITADTGTLRRVANVIHVGRRIATAEAKLTDEHGKLYAHGTTTCLIV